MATEQNKFTYDEVFLAYKKLKNYYYTDNTSLFIKQRIAEFESDIAFGEELEESLALKFNEGLTLLYGPKSRIFKYLKEVIDSKVTTKLLVVKKLNLLTKRTN